MQNNNPRVDIVCFTGNSGLTDYSISLCRAVADLLQVRLVTSDTVYKSYPSRLLSFPVRSIFRRTRHYAVDVLKFVWLVLQDPPHLILFQSHLKFPLLEGALVGFIKRACRAQVALTVHDTLPHVPKPWSRMTHRFFYNRFHKLVVHSERGLADVRELGVTVPARVIPHGIYDLFNMDNVGRDEARRYFPEIPEGSFIVLFFGHIERRKGIFPFLEAARQLENDRHFVFLVAGSNDLDAEERAILEGYRKLSNVVVRDERVPFEEVQYFFAAADVVALPYLEGTTSGVLKLSVAFSRAVLATDVGDLREMLAHGGGVLIDSDEAGLAGRLADSLVSMRQKIKEIEAAVGREMGRCSWPTVGAAYLEFLLDRTTGKGSL